MSKTLTELKTDILADGIIDATEVATLKEAIYADGVIDADEAKILFELNDATTGKENAAEWGQLFVDAITDFVLADETTPNVVDAEEATFLIDNINGDGVVDTNELNLMVNIVSKAESCTDEFNQFVLNSVKAHVIADGVVDADEVNMIKTVIYGTGGAAGADIDRTEADFLFDINDATTDNDGHHESWPQLFVDAISSHVLDDAESPNEIDSDEGDWLISRVEGDGEYDANEKALLANIKAKATSIDGKLKFKMDMFA